MDSPHQDQPVGYAGARLEEARAAAILVHGRGGSVRDVLELARLLDSAGFAFLAPQARGNQWYPNRFTAPIASNEPGISSAMGVISDLLDTLERIGIPAARTVLLGFSQGACLVTEFAARHARRYGAVVGFSGGLIGPDGTSRHYEGTLLGTPVFLGCSDIDPHIPEQRVRETAQVLEQLGARVDLRIYAGMGHTVNNDEVAAVRTVMATILRAADPDAPQQES